MNEKTFNENSKLIQRTPLPLEIEDPKERRWYSWIPHRVFILFMVFWGVLFATQGRLILSISILLISEETGWEEATQGLVLGAFGMGYFWTQLPSIWAERTIGAKFCLAIVVGLCGPFVLAFPYAISNLPLCVFCYVAVGLLQGPLWVSNYSIVLDWFPAHERSSALSSLTAASILGTASALGLTPLIISRYGWRVCFFICGGLDIAWAVAWLIFGQASPEKTGRLDFFPVAQPELDHILAHRAERKKLSHIPFKTLLTYPAILVCFFNHFANNYGYYVLVSWVPTFLKKALGFDLKETGLFSVLPYLLQGLISQFIAYFSDIMIKNGHLTKPFVRKSAQIVGLGTPTIALCLISFMDLTAFQVVILLTIGVAVNGTVSVGYQMSYLDMSTSYASLLFSIGNTGSSLNASLSVYLVGWILQATNFNWAFVWMIGATMWGLCLILFLVYVPTEEIDFDALEKLKEEDNCPKGRCDVFGCCPSPSKQVV